jgi:hypothetical protein
MTNQQLQAIEDRSDDPEHACEDIPLVIDEVRRLKDMLPDCFREVTKEKMIEVFRDITKSMGIRVEDMVRMEGEVKTLTTKVERLREALTEYGQHRQYVFPQNARSTLPLVRSPLAPLSKWYLELPAMPPLSLRKRFMETIMTNTELDEIENLLSRVTRGSPQILWTYPVEGFDPTIDKPVSLVDTYEKLLPLIEEARLLNSLIAILDNHSGERGDKNEKAVNVLERIINERDEARLHIHDPQDD